MFGVFETGIGSFTWGNGVMIAFGSLLIYLAIAKKMEPLLLLPIGFGIILVNLPLGGLMETIVRGEVEEAYAIGGEPVGLLARIFQYGLTWEIIPCFIFLGLGAMTDFAPLIANPKTLILGAAAQFGVYAAMFMALALGFDIKEAASIGIIGGADGPTTIYLTSKLAPDLIGITAISAYTYMAMVPIIQPPIIRAITTKKERAIYMKPQLRPVSQREKMLFPIITMVIIILLVPKCAPLMGMFMFGNLLRESGVTERLADTAANAFMNILTIMLGITVGAFMSAESFLTPRSLLVFGIGITAFAGSTFFGVLIAKFMNLFLKEKINPMIGAAGVSAVPMSARVVQRMGQQANPRNFLLMHAMGPNVAGVIGTATAAGLFLGMLG
ncbi:MAG: sodium ion-translocating decarboxylase subunit beta [Dehalococcoidales bacterium]|nr:sodium ion-translocating decarboxylase subunit beta [Dehalococcoidales bacterium]